MKRFTDAGRQAINDGNLYAALSLALTIPDICGSLEDPGPDKSQSRYERWCNQWLQPKFTTTTKTIDGQPFVWVTGQQVYQLRCSLIHSGSDEIDQAKRTGVDRFFLFDQTRPDFSKFSNCTFNGVKADLIAMSVALFCDEVFKAADKWDATVVGDVKIQNEKAKLLFIHSKGAVIHGVTFG